MDINNDNDKTNYFTPCACTQGDKHGTIWWPVYGALVIKFVAYPLFPPKTWFLHDCVQWTCMHTFMTLHYVARILSLHGIVDCWFWTVPKSSKWRLLHVSWRKDSRQVDSSRGPSLSQVLHCQWCLELWLPPLWDMVTGTQTISWPHQCPGTFTTDDLYLRRIIKRPLPIKGRQFTQYLGTRSVFFVP